MTAEDIEHVQRIARATWSETYNGIIPEELQIRFIDRSYSDSMMMMRMEKTIALVAERDGTPVGFANLTKTDEDGDAELTALYVIPTFQHAGYKESLFEAALSMLPDATQLFVYVNLRNATGRTFYEKQGCKLLTIFEESFEGHPVETAQYVYSFSNSGSL